MSNSTPDKTNVGNEPTDVACLDVISGIARQLGIDGASITIQGKEQQAISLTRELRRDLMRLLGAEEPDSQQGNDLPIGTPPNLSPLEHQILTWASVGKSVSVTAQILNTSEKVVRNAWANIFAKLNCHDRVQCVVVATRLGLI